MLCYAGSAALGKQEMINKIMLPGILGTKVGMTHVYDADGRMVPVTVVQAGPVWVMHIPELASR